MQSSVAYLSERYSIMIPEIFSFPANCQRVDVGYTLSRFEANEDICFLRDAGISINSIGELLSEDNPGSVISVLLEQQEQLLQEEVRERKAKLEMIDGIRRELKEHGEFLC